MILSEIIAHQQDMHGDRSGHRLETTGLSPATGDRAAKVAVVVVDDGKIVDHYRSLMNAGARIP